MIVFDKRRIRNKLYLRFAEYTLARAKVLKVADFAVVFLEMRGVDAHNARVFVAHHEALQCCLLGVCSMVFICMRMNKYIRIYIYSQKAHVVVAHNESLQRCLCVCLWICTYIQICICIHKYIYIFIGKQRVWKGGFPHLETKAEIMGGW